MPDGSHAALAQQEPAAPGLGTSPSASEQARPGAPQSARPASGAVSQGGGAGKLLLDLMKEGFKLMCTLADQVMRKGSEKR